MKTIPSLRRTAIAKENMPKKDFHALICCICIWVGFLSFLFWSVVYAKAIPDELVKHSLAWLIGWLIPLLIVAWFVLKLLFFSINLLRYNTFLRRKKELAERRIIIANSKIKDIETMYLAVQSINITPDVFSLIKGIENKLTSFGIELLCDLVDEYCKGSGEHVRTQYHDTQKSLAVTNMPDIVFDIVTNTEETLSMSDELKRRCLDVENSFILLSATVHRNIGGLIKEKKLMIENINHQLYHTKAE